MENSNVRDGHEDTNGMTDSTPTQKEIEKWLESVHVDIKDSDFDTTPQGRKMRRYTYWEEWYAYIEN